MTLYDTRAAGIDVNKSAEILRPEQVDNKLSQWGRLYCTGIC